MRKEYQPALSALKKAIALNDGDLGACFELGSCYERQKKLDSAAIQFRKLLRLDPNDAVTANYLGYMWADAGVNLDSAQLLIQKALALDTGNGAYLDSYAWVLYKKGDIAGAHRYMKMALDKFSDDPVLFLHWGDILLKGGNATDALRAYRRCLEFPPEKLEPENRAEVEAKIRGLEAPAPSKTGQGEGK